MLNLGFFHVMQKKSGTSKGICAKIAGIYKNQKSEKENQNNVNTNVYSGGFWTNTLQINQSVLESRY